MVIDKGFGYKPDHLDHRDQQFAFTAKHTAEQLPPAADVAKGFIDWVYDQGKESSCVAHASCSLYRFAAKKAGLQLFLPSRNFEYWNARSYDNPPDTNKDEGTQIRCGLKALGSIGLCSEEMWGYTHSTIYAKPPQACYTAAAARRLTSYHSISQNETDLKSCIASGYPFAFGISVFRSMMSEEVAHTGIVPWPSQTDRPIGGHAILCVAYDDSTQKYKFLNSWGHSWGDNGYGYLDYEYVENQYLASDFWTGLVDPSQELKPQQPLPQPDMYPWA